MIIRREDPMQDYGKRPCFEQLYNLNTLDPIPSWDFWANGQDVGALDIDQLIEMRNDIDEILSKLEGGAL